MASGNDWKMCEEFLSDIHGDIDVEWWVAYAKDMLVDFKFIWTDPKLLDRFTKIWDRHVENMPEGITCDSADMFVETFDAYVRSFVKMHQDSANDV